MNKKDHSILSLRRFDELGRTCLRRASPDDCRQASRSVPQHPKSAEPAPPAAIALPEVVVQAEVTAAALRDIEASPGADDATREIAVELPVLTREIGARLGEHAKIMAQRPSLDVLRTLERGWKRTHDPPR
jgi:hypothetical protein